MRAIDLYSGIGGWSLGLRMAGIDVIASYEIWQPAIEIYRRNLGSDPLKTDIRELTRCDLPSDIEVVVGSPPCTQFSYSNRGGGGDIVEGLKDIAKFLEIVEWIKPKYWAMENVPRVKSILEEHVLSPEGKLNRFAHLFQEDDVEIRVLNIADFGLPQQRIRCIAGKLPFELLDDYKKCCPKRTMGEILGNLSPEISKDVLYGKKVPERKISDHIFEKPLTGEETRLNRDSKLFHPIYNTMAFPDELNRPSRTITATCTRVSRESIVVPTSSNRNRHRRLTIRERASLQGFPFTYQFFGRSYSQKIKAIGNAIPPLFTYYVGQALKGERGVAPIHPWELRKKPRVPKTLAGSSSPQSRKHSYTKNRRFRASIPNLRFKSGVRFELANEETKEGEVSWEIRFLYGTPKDIRHLTLDKVVMQHLKKGNAYASMQVEIAAVLSNLRDSTTGISSANLQLVWTHRRKEGAGPHDFIDELGQVAEEFVSTASQRNTIIAAELDSIFSAGDPAKLQDYIGLNGQRQKLENNATAILAGIVIGSWVNENVFGHNPI